MERWEYRIADLTKVEKNFDELNRLGAEGWEAVGMSALADGSYRVTASVSDAAGNSVTAQKTFTVSEENRPKTWVKPSHEN